MKILEIIADGTNAILKPVDPNNNMSINDLTNPTKNIINMVIYIVGTIAVVMVLISGVQYATSQGDPSKIKKAKDTIMYGVIGLVVVILAYAIVNFVLQNVF
jgi:predicted membrane channel-forming protein YqfA (hemolysin III family)